MRTLKVETDLKVFGLEVPNFPMGIKETFDTLVAKVPEGLNRNYYGISYMENQKVVYIAAVEQKNEDEPKKYNCEKYLIEKGEYLGEDVHNWMQKTDSIKDVFHELMQNDNIDCSKPCIEWYKNDDEMVCMVKKS
jgi:predicted transcriptional regulator YdeE